MQNLSERDLRTVRLGGLLVGIILAFILVGFPLMDYWETLNSRLESSQKKLRNIEQGIQDAADAGGALRDVRQKATFYRDALALNQQTARMRQQVESLPGYTGLSVRRLEDMPLRADAPLYRSAVSLQFDGTLTDLHRFLKGVETASPALKVERLTVASQPRNTARVEGQMVIVGYAVVVDPGTGTRSGRG